jgi:peptidoglycan LD-endopeptidase CwlK
VIRYGTISEFNIGSCDARLQRILRVTATRIPKRLDFRVECGHRNKADQDEAYRTGHSLKQWPDGKHNAYPSLAFDFVPTAGGWSDEVMFGAVYGYIQCVADDLVIPIRWLGDGDQDGKTLDQKLRDLGHIELA